MNIIDNDVTECVNKWYPNEDEQFKKNMKAIVEKRWSDERAKKELN